MIKVNGKDVEAAGQTIQSYLQNAGYQTGRIAIELNGNIVPRTSYSDVILTNDDTMEIVQFVGGG